MFLAVLVVLFVIVPFVELTAIVLVSGQIGLGWTLALLLGVSLFGAWLVKREGVGVLRRLGETVDRGEVPTREILDGVLLLAAGAMLLFPGFVTDAVGLLLLLPPVRALARLGLQRRYARRIEGALAFPAAAAFGRGPAFGASAGPGRVFTGTATYDVVDVHEVGDTDERPGDAR